MRLLHYTTEAQEDLISIALYVAGESGSRKIADDFIAKLEARCERLASLPGTLGSARPEVRIDLRSVAFQSYVILFRYDSDVLEIVAVVNGARDLERLFEP